MLSGTVCIALLYELLSIQLPSHLDSLPAFEIRSKLTDLPNLNSFDQDENLIHTIDSKYHSISDMNNIKYKSHSFSFFHANIRSLTKHFEKLHSLLKSTQIPFYIIGITEYKQMVNTNFLKNVNIDGCKLHTQPTRSSHGGVALYFQESLHHEIRWDLGVLDDDFELLWVEIKTGHKSKNILCSCTYRHPDTDVGKFLLSILNQCYLNMTNLAR